MATRVGAARVTAGHLATRRVSAGPAAARRPILVVALGNPIRGDDGIGWAVADEVERRLSPDGRASLGAREIEVERAAVGGLAVMELLAGTRGAVLVDALVTTDPAGIGRVATWSIRELGGRPAAHLDSAHDTTIAAALAAGRSLGIELPAEVVVVTVGIVPSDRFADGLSPSAAAAVAEAAEAVLAAAGDIAARAR